jgi:hypothetical protein
VSNHGEHDLDLIVKDTKIPDLLKAMRDKKPIAALNQEAMNSLAFDDPHLRVETISLPRNDVGENENQNSLIVKVTEIRDGESRATLFLGDIETRQQEALFEHPEVSKIFENVRAVTLPHHGRKRTLSPDFFRKLSALANGNIVALHSDRLSPDPEVRGAARESGIKILSTVPTTKKGAPHDLHVNLFDEPTYFVVKKPTTIRALAEKGKELPVTVAKDVSTQEVAEAISIFTNRKMTEVLPSGTPLSLPTTRTISSYSNSVREQLFTDLQSRDADKRNAAIAALSKIGNKLTREQTDRLIVMMQSGVNTVDTTSWRGPHCTHYEEKTAKYYAGRVLAKMDSPYVTETIRHEARRAQTSEGGGVVHRRVDDPGWI